MADKLQISGGNNTADQNGTDHIGTGQNGIGQNGTGQNGTAQNGQNGTAAARNCSCEFPRIYTDDHGNEIGKIKRLIKTEKLEMNDGGRYTRPHVCYPLANPHKWRDLVPPVRPKTPPKYKTLWVVRQTQIEKNPHWSLFAAFDDDSDSPPGRVWQVNGDPDVGMHYAHRPPEEGVAMFLTRSFLDKLLVCTLDEDQEAELDKIATTIKPPGPSNTSPANKPRKINIHRGTCRTWVWDVLDQLVNKGIAPKEVAEKARELQPKPLV